MLIYRTTEISEEIAELRFQKPDFGFQSGNGIRVILVVARKGGAGKSTFCRALASAAVARGETVTLFDTNPSRSCRDWMERTIDKADCPRSPWPMHAQFSHFQHTIVLVFVA